MSKKDRKKLSYDIVAITDNGFGDLEALEEMLMTADASDVIGSAREEEDDRPYQVQDGVAIIEMKGPMVPNNNWVSRFLGYSTYEGLREAYITALEDSEVSAILTDVDSPGGRVSGVSELSDLISAVDAVKPVIFYSGGQMNSAAYWLSSSGSEIISTKTASVGSIGVIVSHMSYEGKLKQEGMKFTQIKSGSRKAIGSPYKDLTAEEEAIIQAKVDDLFGLFRDHVNANRSNVNPEVYNGDDFLGYKAQNLGLVDKLSSFDEAFLFTANKKQKTTEDGVMKRVMTAEQLEAAAASGAILDEDGVDEALETEGTTPSSGEEPEGDSATAAAEGTEETETDGAAAGTEGDGEADADGGTEAAGEEETTSPETQTTIVDYMKMQLEETQDKLGDARAENKKLKADSVALVGDVDALKEIAIEAINKMQIALGLAKVDMSKMSAADVITNYHATDKQFADTFKVGGIKTGAKPKTDDKPKAANITMLDDARCAGVGLSK